LIREDRDPAFWAGVASHPQVEPQVTFGQDLDFAEIVSNPWVLPLRAEHGGFLFVRLDGCGRVYELHTLFTPEGWGREVLLALKEAVDVVFNRGAQVIVTYDIEGHWRSRPPKTFRFEPCGDFAEAPNFPHRLRTWSLSSAAWNASPARRRM
jgi:hypothetical protein